MCCDLGGRKSPVALSLLHLIDGDNIVQSAIGMMQSSSMTPSLSSDFGNGV